MTCPPPVIGVPVLTGIVGDDGCFVVSLQIAFFYGRARVGRRVRVEKVVFVCWCFVLRNCVLGSVWGRGVPSWVDFVFGAWLRVVWV